MQLLAQWSTASEWSSQDLNLGSLILGPSLLADRGHSRREGPPGEGDSSGKTHSTPNCVHCTSSVPRHPARRLRKGCHQRALGNNVAPAEGWRRNSHCAKSSSGWKRPRIFDDDRIVAILV